MENTGESRRGWMKKSILGAQSMFITSAVVSSPTGPAQASVFTDPDRYGDKELKIATVNKVRQNVRNAILENPSLAPLFLKIAIQDGLTYDPKTQMGGPDGSIVALILSKNAPDSVSGLKEAAKKLSDIATYIKRTTEITTADVVAFAGAEAIESMGGPRVIVQLGKMDPKVAEKATGENSYPDLCGGKNGQNVVQAFLDSGLSEREVALMYGAIASMEKSADSYKKDDDDFEENEMGDVDVFIPSSFGAPKEIYGKQLGKMDNSVFTQLVADVKKGKAPIADVFTNDKVLGWANKYASSKGVFVKDLPEAYGRLMALGERYTGGKVGALLDRTGDL